MARQTADATEKLNLQDYLAPVRRFRWIILALAVIVAAGTYFYYHRKPPVYESSTNVYLGQSAVEQQITDTQVASSERDTANASTRSPSPRGWPGSRASMERRRRCWATSRWPPIPMPTS
jgi:uncharacterized protein involved in exopolysaccharide biosynthesis